jgi:hypothetical protein
MTRKKRTQFLALDVLLGFSDELAKVQGLEPRTLAQGIRLNQMVKKRLESITDEASTGAVRDVMRRFQQVKAALHEYAPDQVPILDYCNALLVVVEAVTRHAIGSPVHQSWDELFDALQTLYESMDADLEETASMKVGTELGERLYLAMAA